MSAFWKKLSNCCLSASGSAEYHVPASDACNTTFATGSAGSWSFASIAFSGGAGACFLQEFIKNKAEKFGLYSSVCKHTQPQKSFKSDKWQYRIRFETRKIAFFLKYYAKEWLMARKLVKLDEYLSRPLISRLYNKMSNELLNL